jgi:hypothetical protein
MICWTKQHHFVEPNSITLLNQTAWFFEKTDDSLKKQMICWTKQHHFVEPNSLILWKIRLSFIKYCGFLSKSGCLSSNIAGFYQNQAVFHQILRVFIKIRLLFEETSLFDKHASFDTTRPLSVSGESWGNKSFTSYIREYFLTKNILAFVDRLLDRRKRPRGHKIIQNEMELLETPFDNRGSFNFPVSGWQSTLSWGE